MGLALPIALEIYIRVAKGSKIKVRKFLGLVSTFVEVIVAKLVGEEGGEAFLLSPSVLNGAQVPTLNKNKKGKYFQCP